MKTAVMERDFAVRIEDVDLSHPLDDTTFDEVRRLWMRYKVALFPNQTLEDGDLVAFARRFGPLFVHVQSQLVSPEHEAVMYMSSRDPAAPVKGELAWHTDQSYTPKPVFGTILYGVEIPEKGGETCFADLAAAYEALPEDLRKRVESVKAVYSPVKAGHKRRAPLTPEQAAAISTATHPLVRTHPYLERKALYLSPNHITTIGDLTEVETEELLAQLVEYATQSGQGYEHRWSEGDVIMWDNTSVMHRRKSFPADAQRFMKRTGFHLPEELRVPF